MTALFNNNFMVGFLLAKNRKDPNERLRIGLQASQFPLNNPLGLVMLKQGEDTLEEIKAERDAFEAEVIRLRPKDPDDTGPSQPPSPADGSVGHLRQCQRNLRDARRGMLDANTRAVELNTQLFDCETKLDRVKVQLERCMTKASDCAKRIEAALDHPKFPETPQAPKDFSEGARELVTKIFETHTTKVDDAIEELRSRVLDCLK